MAISSFIDPQLASSSKIIPSDDRWIHEIKADGYRMQIISDGSKVLIISRHGRDWTIQLKGLVKVFKGTIKGKYILDGELVVLDQNGRTDFQLLQKTIKAKNNSALKFFAFDLLSKNGKSMADQPLFRRKAELRKLIPKKSDEIKYVDHFEGSDGSALFDLVKEHKLEGIISKVVTAPYTSGRSKTWLKIKYLKSDIFVIGGLGRTKDDRLYLLVGQWLDGKLLYKGGVEFGLSRVKATIKKSLSASSKASPFTNLKGSSRIKWVVPKFQIIVNYLEMTNKGRIRQGIAVKEHVI